MNKKLISKIYKILPLYEGKVENEELYLPQDVAYEQYQDYLGIIIIEFSGMEGEPFTEILHYLKGLSKQKEITHANVKKVIFHCISLLKER